MKDDNKKPTVEDQELADMIASMNSGAPKSAPIPPASPATPVSPAPAPAPRPMPTPSPAPAGPVPPTPANIPPMKPAPMAPPAPVNPLPPKNPAPMAPPMTMPSTPPLTDLGMIKKNAMDELRPLVGRLDLPADEKFDTLLLLIRSTDDKSLIKPAHEAAQQITDEKRRAQALLDIVKEIDFFENQK